MPEDERSLIRRFEELSSRAKARGIPVCSEFLTPAEQETLFSLRLNAPFMLEGGYPGAERKVAVFGVSEVEDGPALAPVSCLRAAPVSPKFAEELTHRDFLGALMGLGLRREVLGDILLADSCGFLFCLPSIADYIAEQLVEVRRTPVAVSRADAIPDCAAEPPETSRIVVASERLDAVVAAVYKLSRADSQKLFAQKKVFVNGRPTENTSAEPKPGAMISVRGLGRFCYEGMEAETRRGRLRVNVRIY